MTSITTYRVRFLTRGLLLGLLTAALLAGCEAVPYQVAPQEAALLPPEVAVDYLRTLPAEASVVARPPEAGHCEFTRQGVRVAAANPGYATRTVGELRGELQRLARDREAIEREQRRVEAAQADRPRWMRNHGFAELADEQRRLDQDHASPERWLQARGLPATDAPRAAAAMERERRSFQTRLAPVEAAMIKERQALTDRLRENTARDKEINERIGRTEARVHDPARYERAAFVVFRRLRGTTHFDVEYEVPGTDRTDGCGFILEGNDPEMRAVVQRIATALVALGAEGQPGVKAEPPVGDGRRYTAQPVLQQGATFAPPKED